MRKNYHHGDLKQAAIEQALELIQERGEVVFTIREIAERLKVSHTAVYRHFKSKQDLLVSIAAEGFRFLAESFSPSTEKRSIKNRFQEMGRSYISFAIKNPGYYRAMFHQELRCTPDSPAELTLAGDTAFNALAEILAEGMSEGVFKKSDPALSGRSVWSAMHGFCTLYLDGQFQSLAQAPKKELEKAIETHLLFIQQALLK